MNQANSNYASKALASHVRKIENGHRLSSFQESAYKLLSLLFAYKRSQYKLHLRWNRETSNNLALITIQELSAKKKTDPVLNGIYKALLLLANGREDVVQELLKTAEHRIDEISRSQRAKANAPRELNPVLERVEQIHNKNKGLTPHEMIERLKNDANAGAFGINSFDDELEKFFYDEVGKKKPTEKHIALPSVRNFIAKLRKK